MKTLLLLLLPGFLFAQWQPQSSGTDAHFRAVSAVSQNVVWVGGTKGTFVRTTNGGQTWQAGTVPGAEQCDFRDVHAVSADVAYLMSAGPAEQGQARLYKTTDGGKNWQLQYETKEHGVFFDCLDFWNDQDGIVFSDPVSSKWYVLSTHNGGKTWERIAPDQLPPNRVGEAAFAASGTTLRTAGKGTVWIGSGGTNKGRVFRSEDQGATWQVVETPMNAGPTAGIFGLWIGPNGRGMAVGGDYKEEKKASQNVIVTTDGGKTWTVASPTDPAGLKEGIGQLSDKTLIAVGPSGTCLSSDFGKTWQKIDESSFHAISCADGRCWAVGSKGTIAVYK